MKIWIDAQLSPALAPWMEITLHVEARALRDLALRDAKDVEIFRAARQAGAIVLTKDSDFVTLLEMHGSPPQILWLTLGNSSNERVRTVLARLWPRITELVNSGESLIEIQEAR